MTTCSASQTFWAYRDKDGKLATPLYDGQAPATKFLVDVLERPHWHTNPLTEADYVGEPRRQDYRYRRDVQKAHSKKMRDLAKKDISGLGYRLVTFCLVEFVGPKTAKP